MDTVKKKDKDVDNVKDDGKTKHIPSLLPSSSLTTLLFSLPTLTTYTYYLITLSLNLPNHPLSLSTHPLNTHPFIRRRGHGQEEGQGCGQRQGRW